MTIEEAIKRYTSNAFYEKSDGNLQGCLEFRQLAGWLKDYKRLLEQTNGDCISRQAVMDCFKKWQPYMATRMFEFEDELKSLPSVQPKADILLNQHDSELNRVKDELEPKTGHWIIIDDCELFMAKCSECGEIVDSRMIHKYPYCHCGAKMESEGEE